ncbi:unnamed protein product [Caenorhabditis bovis]|uniref:DBF4-type domain-containing protein n=1 Tax=Caenorhabditis bovis TaxID=2654633 RepID=A0A8S1EWE0_9PELO|nr:unnamed protein product [Caenorhabditis bovis]
MTSESRGVNRFDVSSASRDRAAVNNGLSLSGLLKSRSFLLEIDNSKDRDRLTEYIRRFGGHVVQTFDDSNLPVCVVSDHAYASRIEHKQVDVNNPSEKLLKALPALLREAVKKQVKIRTVTTFIRQLTHLKNNAQKSSSATNSAPTVKARATNHPTLSRQVMPETSPDGRKRRSSMIGKSFVRIDIPGRRPDIRIIDKTAFRHIYSGNDAAFCIFKRADEALKARRMSDYNNFVRGTYIPVKKANYKLEDDETYCQFCGLTVDKMLEHVKTDAHRNKVRHQGILPELERVVMTTKLAMNVSSQNRKRKLKDLILEPELVETYEYGENQYQINWSQFVKRRSPPISPAKNEAAEQKSKTMRISWDGSDLDFLRFIGHA